MASLEDYDEFGNYIGADLDSDDEDQIPRDAYEQQPQSHAAPLEGFDDEPMPTAEDNALMEVDGTIPHSPLMLNGMCDLSLGQNRYTML